MKFYLNGLRRHSAGLDILADRNVIMLRKRTASKRKYSRRDALYDWVEPCRGAGMRGALGLVVSTRSDSEYD